MAFRSDIDIDFSLSPRIARILAPSVEVTIQDLYDTLRVHEAYAYNTPYNKLLSAGGKEELGGGVLVGITTSLKNTKVQFEERTISITSGTATSAGTFTLIDTNNDFVAAGVQPGAAILNVTDRSFSSVIQTVSGTSGTKLLHTGLSDGDLNVWEVGDEYKIWNIIQCNVAGGNLVAVDNEGSSISPVLPSAFTQVVRTSSSSATLLESAALEFGVFSGFVAYDPTGANSGTDYPVGTLLQPVNNIADALQIAKSRGLTGIICLGDAVLSSGDFSGLTIKGIGGRNNVRVDIESAAVVVDCRFEEVTSSGVVDYPATFVNCIIEGMSFPGEFLDSCVLRGTIELTGNQGAFLFNCTDADPSSVTPTLDLSSFTGSLSVRRYSGGIAIKNKTTSDTVAIDLDTGRVSIESSVTAGNIRVRGIGTVSDSSTGSAVVDTTSLLAKDSISAAVRTELTTELGRIDTTISSRAQPGDIMAISTADKNSIVDAVLEELVADHQGVSGSLAEALMIIKGLTQNNFVLDTTIFNAKGLMTSGRMRVFSTAGQVAGATDAGAGQGELASFTVTVEAEPAPNEDRVKIYKVSRD